MRYTVPAGRDPAPYAKWHEESAMWHQRFIFFGALYPVIICLIFLIYGGFLTFVSAVLYMSAAYGFSWLSMYKRFGHILDEFEGDALKESAPEYQKAKQILEELCQKAGIDWRPDLIVFELDEVQGFSARPHGGNATLVVSTGNFAYSENVLRAIMAHELAHLLHEDNERLFGAAVVKHNMVLSFLSMVIALPLVAISSLYGWQDMALLTALWGFSGLYMRALGLMERAYMRRREYLADGGAVALIGWQNRIHMAVALHWSFVSYKCALKKKLKEKRSYRKFDGSLRDEGWLEGLREKAIESIDHMEEEFSVFNTHPTGPQRWAAMDVSVEDMQTTLGDNFNRDIKP
jgi:Zn-dependent protease with chaperone function